VINGADWFGAGLLLAGRGRRYGDFKP